MISVEDMQRCAEASKCDSCLYWHKYCKAECCKVLDLKIDPNELTNGSQYVRLKVGVLSPSDQWYFRLRGISYNRGILNIPKKNIEIIGKRIVYFYVCDNLDENYKCKGHPDKKPKICRDLNEETALQDRFYLTDNCLYKYKLMKGGLLENEKDKKS